MLRDRRVALADHPGAGEDRTDRLHLRAGKRVDALQFTQQPFVLLDQGWRGRRRHGDDEQRPECGMP